MSRADRFRYRTEDCAECSGSGEMFEVARMTGEYFDADFVSERCPYCDGTGEQDAYCHECGKHNAIDDEGECEMCHDKHELSVADFNEKYGLTVCRGDPMLKRRAA